MGTCCGECARRLRRPGGQRCGSKGVRVVTQEVKKGGVWHAALQQVVKDGRAVGGLKCWQLSRCGGPLRGLRRCDGAESFSFWVTLQRERQCSLVAHQRCNQSGSSID